MNPTASEQQRQRIEEFQGTNQLGLATLFFSDLVGSTQLKQNLGDRAAVELLQAHHAAFRELLAQFSNAEEIDTAGDSFFLIFATPSDAVRFALLAQARTFALASESGYPLRDRVGIHVGEVFIKTADNAGKVKDLFGIAVDSCARIMSLGEGDQILLSRFAFDNARQALRGDVLYGLGELVWLNHGLYEMKGVEEPVEICEVGEAARACLKAPESGDKAHRVITGDEPVLGWRPAAGQLVPNTQWVLDRLLGEGGFGEVWLARHQTLKDRRVFKFCFNAEKARSLKREVTLFRVLREHVGAQPGIVAVHDVYFDQPPYYLVMDHIDGPTLTGWAEAHAPLDSVPLETRLEIVAQIADALQTAHDAGVIHRDVKPSNILIAEEAGAPRAMLTDFGIGQLISKDSVAGITQLGFTQTMLNEDSMSGTQLYLAPELLSGHSATIRSDIYAIGIVLYQLVVGAMNRPLTSDWDDDITDSLLREDIRNCVAGDPAKRFAGGAQLSAHLRALPQRRVEKENAERLEARAARRKKQVRLMSVAAAAVAVAAIFFAFAFLRERDLKSKVAEEGRRAQREAERANAEAIHATEALAALRKTAPTFADQARIFSDQGRLPEAIEKIGVAIELAPKTADYYLASAELLQAAERWDEAVAAFAEARMLGAQSPHLDENERLTREFATALSAKQKIPDNTWITLGNSYRLQKRSSAFLSIANRLKTSTAEFMPAWQERVNAWLGNDAPKVQSHGAGLQLTFSSMPITSLEALRGCPLGYLDISYTKVIDLSPLEGMPLETLNIRGLWLPDFRQLRGLRLHFLDAREINNVVDLSPLEGMPLAQAYFDLSPGQRRKAQPVSLAPLRGAPLFELSVSRVKVESLEGLQGSSLRSLNISDTEVATLAPMTGVPLKHLTISNTKVTDLTPLSGAPLDHFYAWNTGIKDLSPLRGAPLEIVVIGGCKEMRDLSVLAECRTLRELVLPPTAEHVEAFRKHPKLEYLSYQQNALSGHAAQTVEEFWKEYDAQQAARKM